MTLNKAKARRQSKNKGRRIKVPVRNKGSKLGRLFRTSTFDLFMKNQLKD